MANRGIVGLLPMGGLGTRLGQPGPKPLLPTITAGGIVPLYRHTYDQIRVVADTVFSLVHTGTCSCVRALGMPLIETSELALAGALGRAGQRLSRSHGADLLVAIALPDSIWHLDPGRSLADVADAVRGDGAVGLFRANANELDDVILDGDRVKAIVTKDPEAQGRVTGWGAFVVRAGALAQLRSDEKDGPQFGRMDLGWAVLGESVDLGTPERYIAWHDQR